MFGFISIAMMPIIIIGSSKWFKGFSDVSSGDIASCGYQTIQTIS